MEHHWEFTMQKHLPPWKRWKNPTCEVGTLQVQQWGRWTLQEVHLAGSLMWTNLTGANLAQRGREGFLHFTYVWLDFWEIQERTYKSAWSLRLNHSQNGRSFEFQGNYLGICTKFQLDTYPGNQLRVQRPRCIPPTHHGNMAVITWNVPSMGDDDKSWYKSCVLSNRS